MAIKKIERLLEQALIRDGEMPYALYEHELEELLDKLKSSLIDDNDDYIFAVTENTGDVAMVLIDESLQVHINEQAREKLKEIWLEMYETNMKKLIPIFAKQLEANIMPINGIRLIG